MDTLLRNFGALQLQSRCASNDSRQSKMLQKLMTGKKKSGLKWGVNVMPKPEALHPAKKIPSKLSSRRTTVLNKMFMRHVTEIIATGPIGYELKGLGLEITQVKVCQNYHGLNIFWTASGISDFEYVEQKLLSITKQLRHELHQMQLLGNIPHLTFIKDHQLSYFDELDAVIEKADYGEDFKPLMTRSRDTNFEFQNDENNAEYNNRTSIPPMRHDVFGLDHALIMGRVKQSLAKSKQAWKSYEEKQLNPSNTKPFTFNTSFESIREEQITAKHSQDVLNEFLQKRKLLRKMNRAEDAEFKSNILDEEDLLEGLDNDFKEQDNDFDEVEKEKFYDELDSFEK